MHMPDMEITRHVKRVTVPPQMLANMLTQPAQGVSYEIESGLPPTAGVIGAAYDHESNCFVLFVADESFEEVKLGTIPPELPVQIKVVYGGQ